MLPRFKFEFLLTAPRTKLPLDIIAKALQLNPTATWRKGDIPRPGAAKHRQSGWIFSTTYRDNLHLDKALKKFIQKLARRTAAAIRRLIKKHNLDAQFSIVVIMHHQTPCFTLDPTTLQDIAQLHASLDIDLILM